MATASLRTRITDGVFARTHLDSFRRVTDAPTWRKLLLLAVVSTGVSFLEVVALAAVAPLVQLLSGTNLEDTGTIGHTIGSWIPSDWSHQRQTLAVLVFVVTLLFVRAVIAAIVRWWNIGFVAASASRATTSLFSAYIKAPLEFFSVRNTADMTRTAAISLTNIFANGLVGISTVITEISMVILVGLLLLVASPLGAIAAVVYFSTAMYLFNRAVQRRTRHLGRERDEIQASWLALLQQALGGLREIRLRHAEPEYTAVFHESRDRQTVYERKIMFSAEFGRYYLEATFMLGFGVLGTVIILTQGNDSLAVLGLMMAAGFRLLPSAGRLLYSVSSIRQAEGSLSIVLDELEGMHVQRLSYSPELFAPRQLDEAPTPRRPPFSVRFENVTFRYPGTDTHAIRDLSGFIEAGSSLGVVGPSGSGKTTTVDLLCGLLSPTSGSLSLNDMVLPGPDMTWQKHIAYVPQEIFLLDGSVAENIAFSRGTIDPVAMERAIRLAQLEDFVAALPNGLDTPTGERGGLLSGGQRQRIGIARALYRTPSLLILDEATSALDVETESYITNAINALAAEVTTVVVAHRLSTIKNCDRILVLEQGQAVGWDSFSDLMLSNDRFANWVQLAGMRE